MIDFLVIGGGIAGISAAARLSHLGSVTVLEREAALAYHASGRSAALFEKNYGNDAVKALNTASFAYHQFENGGVLSPRGLIMVGRAFEAEQFDADVFEMGLDRISLNEAHQLVPILDPKVIAFAAAHDAALDIDTDLLVQNFAREVRAHGGTIIQNAPVTAITRTATGWDVTAGDVFEARYVINAAGAWVDEVAETAGITPLGFQPYRRSMARLASPGGHDVSQWPMVFGAGETWYAKPDAGALIVSPADEDPILAQDAWPDDWVLAEGLDRYEQHVTTPLTRPLSTWAGLRTFASDRSLVLGPSSQDETFIWCAGQGGYGFATAPAASRLVADLIGGIPSELPDDVLTSLSPHRFAT
jgi:glycine/D-amino acid oxidase-like deaminating enzyme